jgi:hypothetical protein
MFLNSSGIISITDSILKSLQTFWVEKAYKLFFLSSRISARYIPNYFVLLGAHVFEHVHPFASLLVKSQTKFTSKSRNKQATRTLKWQEMIERNSELLTPHPWCNMGRKRKCRSVLCGLDEHLLRQIDGKFWSQSSVIISPWWLFRSVIIPWFYYLKLPV